MLLKAILLAASTATLTSAAASCTGGAWGCQSNALSVCQEGTWVAIQKCSSGESCMAGPAYGCFAGGNGGGENPPEVPEEPTEDPSGEPEEPTEDPTDDPEEPTEDPTEDPEEPSEDPEEPSEDPEEPSEDPEEPSEDPEEPSEDPEEPSEDPEEPSEDPEEPSEDPEEPTEDPTDVPEEPTEDPTDVPEEPTEDPTDIPEDTEDPTDVPEEPTEDPTEDPEEPTEDPTDVPEEPTEDPTEDPTDVPEEQTEDPTDIPEDTEDPTDVPEVPTEDPTDAPTEDPTDDPEEPTEDPTEVPEPTTTTTSATTTTTTTTLAQVPSPTTKPPQPPVLGEFCYPKYSPGKDYSKDSIVSSNGVNYKAKYQTKSDPGQAGDYSDWSKMNACDVNTLKPRPFTTPGMIGYWANWAAYSRPQTNIDLLDLSGFSAINYAFVDATDDGSIKSFDDWADFLNLSKLTGTVRAKYPNIRALISIGGWSGSKHISNIAKSETATANFVKNVQKYLNDNGFDGVDIDWEHPGGGGLPCNAVDPQDAINYAKLLKALRTALGPDASISIAASANAKTYVVNGKNYLPEIAESLSYIQVMTYDYYGSWSPYSDFNSPLHAPGSSDPRQPAANGKQWSIAGSMAEFEAAGVPKSKLVPGIGFYGRSWTVESDANNGLYQHCAGAKSVNASCTAIQGDVLDDPWDDKCPGSTPGRSGVWMYLNLRGDTAGTRSQSNAPLAGADPFTATNGWIRKYYDFAESPTLYNPTTKQFISYDDPQSIEKKTSWAKKSGYAGIMTWELDQDYKHEMINAMRKGWGV
ncbi:glycosyl hydrolases family 18-domain-containing protein [Obelidium mucronatum]|nr:glycosyl hydrolases family 18-domain-containing protein [Obelidium mucronatum]